MLWSFNVTCDTFTHHMPKGQTNAAYVCNAKSAASSPRLGFHASKRHQCHFVFFNSELRALKWNANHGVFSGIFSLCPFQQSFSLGSLLLCSVAAWECTLLSSCSQLLPWAGTLIALLSFVISVAAFLKWYYSHLGVDYKKNRYFPSPRTGVGPRGSACLPSWF